MPSTQTDRIDGLTTSIAVKAPVKAATTGPLAFVGTAPAGYQTIDGIACTDNISVTDGLADRVLVKDQADTTQNGIYLVSSGAWSRALDFDGARDAVNGTLVPVIEGSSNGGTFWMCVATDTKAVVFGTSAITFRAWPYGWGGGGGGGGDRGKIQIVRDLIFRYDNAGSQITPGVLGDLRSHMAGTIIGWTLIGDQTGSIQLDMWKKAYADNVPPTIANTIVAAAPPAIVAGQSKTSSVLTGWTTAVADGDAWRINCNSCDTITRFTLVVHVQTTLQVSLDPASFVPPV